MLTMHVEVFKIFNLPLLNKAKAHCFVCSFICKIVLSFVMVSFQRLCKNLVAHSLCYNSGMNNTRHCCLVSLNNDLLSYCVIKYLNLR